MLVFTQCTKDEIIVDGLTSSEFDAKGGKDITTSEEETTGNNLSFPVIWSDGVAKTMNGTIGEYSLLGEFYGVWGVDPIDPNADLFSCGPFYSGNPCNESEFRAYSQKDAKNVWQAFNGTPDAFTGKEGILNVDLIDWGDNLESIDWNLKSQVRTEVVLYENLNEKVEEIAMRHSYSWGEDEVHGAKTALTPVDGKYLPIKGDGMQATVYTPNARLTIQKLFVEDLEELNGKLKWNKQIGWSEINSNDNLINDVPLFGMSVNEASDGPGFYNAEINVKGKVIFGYTWNVRKLNEDAGYYRITFSFDETGGPNLNTAFDNLTEILLPIEEEEDEDHELIASKDDEGDSGEGSRGGIGIIDVQNNLTYMDVLIIKKTSGSGGGGGGGGHSGGGSGSGGGGGHSGGGSGHH